MSKYKLVIFDLDGTLMDTSKGILNSVIYTINQLGYEMPSPSVLQSFVGPRIQDSLKRIYDLEGETLDKAASIFRNHYKQGNVLLASSYDGIFDVLDTLKSNKIHIAVATNKRCDFADELLHKYDFMEYVEKLCGTDLAGKLVKTDLIRNCISNFPECDINTTVMIGDSAYDAIAAQEVGVDFIGVTYGFEFKDTNDLKPWPHVSCVKDPISLLNVIGVK